MKLAIATCNKYPQLASSDKPLVPLFENQGISVEPAVWNDPSVDWASFDGILIRSTWDYHLHIDEFKAWLNSLKVQGLTVLNPVTVIEQNLHKFYLQELERKGVEIIPSIFVPKGSKVNLSSAKTPSWNRTVLKPAVSASAYLTQVFEITDLKSAEQEFTAIALKHDLLLQPFMPEVITNGEISMLFFNREFSHAVIKIPAQGDFRVQMEYGGTTHTFHPADGVITSGENILKHIAGDLLYARIDGIIKDGRFVLMELELIEPFLFFDYKTGAIEKFVDEAVKMLQHKNAR